MPPATDTPDLTIVVPVHNAREHLDTLVADVQAIPDLTVELILVDDGSSDGSESYVDDLAARHPGVLALHNPSNLGAGVARNTGFPHARGRYTLFFDADDRIHGDVAAEAVALLDASKADVAMCAYNYERDSGAGRTGMIEADRRILKAGLKGKTSRLLRLEELPVLLGFTNYPWNKIIRTRTFRRSGLRYGRTVVNNDILGHWHTLLFASEIMLLDKVLCTHIVFSAGANLTNRRDAVRMSAFGALEETYDLLRAHPELRQRYAHHYWAFALKLADWVRGRLSRDWHEHHRAALQALVSRIDLSDYARMRRKRSRGLAQGLMNVLLG